VGISSNVAPKPYAVFNTILTIAAISTPNMIPAVTTIARNLRARLNTFCAISSYRPFCQVLITI
jgi:hypothetical protein